MPREGAPPTCARALLEAMRAAGHKGNEQDLGYLIKRAFRAHHRQKGQARQEGCALCASLSSDARVHVKESCRRVVHV